MGRKHYYCGTKNIICEEGTQPEGFVLGTYLSEETRKKLSDKVLGDKNPMKRKEIAQKVGDSQRGEKSAKWGTKNSAESNRKNSESHKGDKNPMKRKEVSQKVAEKLKGKEPWNKGLTKDIDPRVAISEEVLEARKVFYSSMDSDYYAPIVKKRNDAMRKNGTMCSSKEEDVAYSLLTLIFGVNDVYRQYTSDDYPYKCDFYIKSIDTYIECNFYFTHGKHPFGTEENDIKILEEAKIKSLAYNGNKNLYDMFINVWSKSDVEKINCAKNNNLNYFAFYTMAELENWINSIK